jgi:hypothetical protein
MALTTDLRGALPDGTQYRMALPPGWNRVLLLDLDFAVPPGPVHQWLLGRG